ncbi:MAG: hypothetical protein AAF570_00605, partial [Bacteroidota bacterium]
MNTKREHYTLTTLIVLPLLSFFLCFVSVKAQDCEPWYPMDEGAEFEMTSYNAKGKVQSSTKHKIVERTGSGNSISATVEMESFDKKGNSTYKTSYGLACEDGHFNVDMRSMMSQENMGSMQNMEVKVDAEDLSFPASLSPGQSLPDATLKVSMSSTGFSMGGMTILVTNRKVLAKEKR